jgi:hypothetical protein
MRPPLTGLGILLAVGCAAGGSNSPPPTPAQTVVRPAKAEPRPAANTGLLVLLDRDGSRWYFLDSREAAALLAVDVTRPPYQPSVPAGAAAAGTSLSGLFSVCASMEGNVARAEVRESSGSDTVDRRWLETLRSWRYRPYLVGGKPVAFCSEARLQAVAPPVKGRG